MFCFLSRAGSKSLPIYISAPAKNVLHSLCPCLCQILKQFKRRAGEQKRCGVELLRAGHFHTRLEQCDINLYLGAGGQKQRVAVNL